MIPVQARMLAECEHLAKRARLLVMAVEVVPYREEWQAQFLLVRSDLQRALADIPVASIEHVGSTSVPGVVAKPILDIDILVDPSDLSAAMTALARIGYVHAGDLGVAGREAMLAPDDQPKRHVYVCHMGALSVRNHLAVRDVLRRRDDLRDEYAAVKLSLAADPGMDMARYIAAKSEVVQKILLESDLTDEERLQILRLNDPARFLRPMTISDVSTVIEVQEPGAVRSLSAVFPQDEYPFPQDEVAARWLQELEHPTIECFVVVVDDDAVVGFAAIRHDEFLHFGIAVERWGTGLAQWAHDAVLDRMRERGIERACLRVFTGNGRGRRFYEKLGWQATGTRTRSTFPPNPELLHYERVIDLQVT